ncbi:MAG: hypothetical protein AAGG44_08710 [Planctomycetota bacterium]
MSEYSMLRVLFGFRYMDSNRFSQGWKKGISGSEGRIDLTHIAVL